MNGFSARILHFMNRQDAERAKRDLHLFMFCGRQMHVEWYRHTPSGSDQGGEESPRAEPVVSIHVRFMATEVRSEDFLFSVCMGLCLVVIECTHLCNVVYNPTYHTITYPCYCCWTVIVWHAGVGGCASRRAPAVSRLQALWRSDEDLYQSHGPRQGESDRQTDPP